ncbi:MAG: hypothetical protein AAF514_20830 [Verrucomicrobiota bacterium]
MRGISARSIQFRFPRKLVVIAAILTGAAVLTAFKPASPRVLERLAIEEMTLERSREIYENLEELIDELEEETEDPEEKELLNPDQLREWVKDLKETKDRKEALRQYAQLEKKISQAANRLSQQRDQQLLARAARELQKAPETAKLGQKLKEEKYKAAAEDLQKMKPQRKNKLSERRKKLARLKSAAQRMASGARQSQDGNDGGDGDNDSSDGSLQDLLEELEGDLAEFDGDLEDLEDLPEIDPEDLQNLEDLQDLIEGEMDELADRLRRLAAKMKIQGKLRGLGQRLGQAQNFMANPNAGLGGKQAGVGSTESRRDERDELKDNGQNTRLKGLKGRGPSLSSVESAEDGTGVSRRKAAARERTFQRQVESFVEREDVPDEVKDGVKRYFENIHQGAAELEPEILEE